MVDNHGFQEDVSCAGKVNSTEPQTAQRRISISKNIFSISRHMLPSKIVFACAGGVTGSFYPYINVFLTSIGLSVSAAGFIGGMRLVPSSIIGPLWGILIDYTGQRKIIFTILCLGTGVTIFSLPWTAQYILINNNGTLGTRMMQNNSYTSSYHQGYHPDQSLGPSNSHHGFTSQLFYVMLISILASSVFDIPLQGFIDSFVMNVVQSNGHKNSFGMQKLFCSIFFGISNFLAGVAADHVKHPKTMSKYTAVFFVFLTSIIFLIPAGLFLLRQTKWESNNIKNSKKKQENGKNRGRHLKKTLLNIDNLLFLFSVCLVGVASAVLLGYLFMLMDHEMNASKSCMGLAVLVSCLVQIPLFPASHRIIKIIGSITCIELALISYFIRFMLVSVIKNPYIIILTQLFHCFGFALFWAASVEHIGMISPKEIYCTMYSVLTSMYWGLGGIIGNILGGFVFTHYGGRFLFRGTAIVCAVWALVMINYFHVFKRFYGMKKQSTKSVVSFDNMDGEMMDIPDKNACTLSQ